VKFFSNFAFILIALFSGYFPAAADVTDNWQSVCAKMPLKTNHLALDLQHGAPALLESFRSNSTVKALIILPGASDELHFYNRATMTWTNTLPTLADAIIALTNLTRVRVAFHPPFLLLHATNDILNASIDVRNPSSADSMKLVIIKKPAFMLDASWSQVAPLLQKSLGFKIEPQIESTAWWHFYRSNFSGFGLSNWELLEIVSLSSKVSVSLDGNRIQFSIRI
jgi:hypothetical protein